MARTMVGIYDFPMKKVLFIHGFEASANSVWFPWLEGQLKQFGYEVINQTWPNSKHPNFEDSMAFLEDLTKDFLPHDSIVGHSLGGFFALKLAEKMELDRIFVVAPAVGVLPYARYRKLWPNSNVEAVERVLEHPVDMSKIRATHKVAVFSDDDHLIPIESANEFDDSWNVLKLSGFGHFQEKSYPDLFYRLMTM